MDKRFLTHCRLFNEAKRYLVGGVNSPLRSFKAVGGRPIFMKKGSGAQIQAEDGRRFIDYCLCWGALILGHSHPKVREALQEVLKEGWSFGMASKPETELAKVIIQAMPSIERIRFTNSGTEAVITAIRLARAFTKKNKVIKFAGAYHGHADYLLDCPGVPSDFKKYTLIAPYNNIEKVQALVRRYKKDIAAVIIEPVAANMGVVLPEDGFLQELRKITQRHAIVLIFDEVITGFRLAFGGAQELFAIKPDLTCLGKIIGGGLPIGALGGKYKIMKLLAPEGEVYQAGTFSGNPLSMHAGLTTLEVLSEENPYEQIGRRTKYLCENINALAEVCGTKLRINFIGSLFSLCFMEERDLLRSFYQKLLQAGVYFSPSSGEANFISTAHKDKEIKNTLKAIEKILPTLRRGQK